MVTLFEISWNDYDSYEYNLLTHPEKTKDTFDADVEVAIRVVGAEYVENEDGYIHIWTWLELAMEYMIGHLGYTEIKPIRHPSFGSLMIETDDLEYLSEAHERWRGIIGEDLFAKIVRHNDEVTFELDNDIDL